MAEKDDFKSYQARQGLKYVQERPKFIQDFMERTGTTPKTNSSRPPAAEPDFDDEMPMMVDSDGNVLTDFPTAPTPTKQPAGSTEEDLVDSQELEFLEASLKEFEHETIDPSELTQQPSMKRGRTAPQSLAVRDKPKLAVNNTKLLSFSMEDEDETI